MTKKNKLSQIRQAISALIPLLEATKGTWAWDDISAARESLRDAETSVLGDSDDEFADDGGELAAAHAAHAAGK